MKTNDKERLSEKDSLKEQPKQENTDLDTNNFEDTKGSDTTRSLELDEDIRNDIEHTEVIPHVKKRHPLNTDRSDEDVEWKDEQDKEPDTYEKENDDKGNFGDGL